MWAHYADSHRGFVIGLDERSEFLSGTQRLPGDIRLSPVTYSDQRPILSYSTIDSPSVFLTKSPEWAYEHEWRLIRLLSEASRVVDQQPYPVCLFAIPSTVIAAVILGACMPESKKAEIVSLCSQLNLKHITIHHARLNRNSFALDVSPSLDGTTGPQQISGEVPSAR